MRRRQYVVRPSKGVIRRQRLDVEYVDRRASDLLVLQDADQSLLIERLAPRDALIILAVGFILCSSASPTSSARWLAGE